MFSNPTDSRWSWVIAFSCCFINCLLYGVIRLSGLLLVATVDTFEVTRAGAALPFTVGTSVRNLSGIFVGYLGEKFGLRYVIISGCLLAALGVGICFFISDIFWITVCWGGIFGFGSGLATCLLPLAINQAFDQHRGTASGISYSGGYIGSFIFPLIVVQLLDNYGLQGTFIVLSGILLNGLAIGLLFPTSSTNMVLATQPNTSNNYSKRRISGISSHSGSYCKKLWAKLIKYMRRHGTFLTNDLTNVSKKQSIHLTRAVFLRDPYPDKCTSSSCVEFQNIIFINVPQNSEILTSASSNLKHCHTMENTKAVAHSDFKEISAFKYKTKLLKMNKFLLFPFFRKRYSFDAYLQQTPIEDVKLIYFLNLHRYNFPSTTTLNYTNTSKNCILNSNILYKYFASYNNNQQSQFIKTNCILKQEPENTFYLEGPNCQGNFQCVDLNGHNVLTKRMSNVSFAEQNDIETSHRSQSPSINVTSSSDKMFEFKEDEEPKAQLNLMKGIAKCCFGWCFMYADPMFVVITTTMSLHTFVVVCMVTIIEDFASDLKVPHSQGHYVLMVLSTADLMGALTLGVITDRGFMSRSLFIIICFFGTGVSSIAITFSNNLTTLLILVALYGIFETGVIITFPLIIAQFIKVKKQATALASTNVLSSPTVLLVPLVIGYFRDRNGCYFGVFYVLGFTSFICSFTWLLAPFLINKYKKHSLHRHSYTLPF